MIRLECHKVYPPNAKYPESVPGDDLGEAWWFWCGGCETHHYFRTKAAKDEKCPIWDFDGNVIFPTFSPSLIVKYTDHTKCVPNQNCDLPNCKGQPFICHLHLQNGILKYLGDCTHKLKGMNVPLPDMP